MDERSRGIEVSARSVEQAVLQALQQLGLGRDQVEVEVIKQGSRGLLGLLSEEAVVRVTPKAPAVAPTEQSAAGETQLPSPAPEVPVPSPAKEQDEIARLGIEVLQNLLNYMGLRAQVSREDIRLKSQGDTNPVLLNISGTGLGALIGRRGETLRDLQFLTCLMISRHTQHWPNVIVDVEHYKSRREKALTDLARRMAERVRITAQPVSLEPMPPRERRIVHLALHDDPGVFTESTGQGEKRKVVIMPKK